MIVSINQPAYLPWLGYFDRIVKSDIHIVLDHVQFEKNSYVNRNKIRSNNSDILLTVPVKTKNKFGNLKISNIEIDNNISWRKKHWKSIETNYSKSKFFSDHYYFFNKVYTMEWSKLFNLIEFINSYLLKVLNIKTKILRSSELEPKANKANLILELCKKVEAKKYISGPLGRNYLDQKAFEHYGINLQFQDYLHPTYKQTFDGFESHMSIIDLLFNHGSDSLNILSK